MTNFDRVISRYGTYSTQWDYIQDRFGEKNLLPFSISDMDFELPSGTKQVLNAAVEKGIFGYTRWNHKEFKGAISGWFRRQFHTQLKDDWIVYSPSVIYSLSTALQLLSKRAGKIVTLTPCYDAFFNTIKENHQQLISVSLIKNERFDIDFSTLEEAFKTEQPELFLLCNPHNPTGRAFTEEELLTIIDLCNRYQVGLISDEIHMDIRRSGIDHLPVLKFIKQIKVPVMLVSSASKSFNTPGLGCSYCVIPDEKLRDQFLTVLKGRDGLSSVPYLGLLALQDCYTHQELWLQELNHYIDGNFQVMHEQLKNHPFISSYIPEASYLAWLDLTTLPVNMAQLQKVLIQQEKVAIMRGETYGAEGSMYLRLNLGAPREKILEGTERLLRGIQAVL
ncbi:aminotransferase class I/II-fold pyridoxal phosphate-dependent enzyme [Enterococcus sp. BWB1-3]|uniref:MalY/PatB family protein n=1 Tax=Enterococcus sp. BWB1-3 TaxID=2787713 RepID=UPI001921AD3E|nr:aminotransferase class I/II-fold pyridoxal phosphate-dependent enzyme [Enterococcus sp. BWB1-3]MBL1229173.1 aminotransferase class I/II-fold pyridoxal phosphate-dependent enzyme [Enterococcus sp. BWB1-3]